MPWEKKLVFHGHREKFIHSVGVVATAEWRSLGSHGYTGVFTGSQHVIIRMSLASQPDPQQLKTTPGIALKFLRDGVDSGNMVAMFSVDGQQSWNFFRNNFTNHIPSFQSPALFPLGAKFATATRNIQQVGLSDMARYERWRTCRRQGGSIIFYHSDMTRLEQRCPLPPSRFL